MSDADAERKAKAARAKKLLAARQREKSKAAKGAATETQSTHADSTAAPSARTSLSLDGSARDDEPARESVPTERTDTPTHSQTNDSVVPEDDPTGASVSKLKTPSAELQSTDSLANLQQTVSLLIAERTDLQNQVSELKTSLKSSETDGKLLSEGRTLISSLEAEKAKLQADLEAARGENEKSKGLEDQVSKLEKDLADVREREKEVNEKMDQMKHEEEMRSKSLEQEKADLQRSLDRVREREGGLETEVGRLRQSNTELGTSLDKTTSERDDLRASASSDISALSNLQTLHQKVQTSLESLQAEHTQLQSSHQDLTTQYDNLKTEHDRLTKEGASNESTISSLKDDISQSQTKLEEAQIKFEGATKRADAVEKKRSALQEENGELFKQLEEVRGRVVQVLDEKVVLAASLEEWETRSKGWDKQKEELRSQLSSQQNGGPPSTETSLDTAATPSTVNTHTDRIRELESSLQASTSRTTSLTRQLTDLQAAYAQASRDRDEALMIGNLGGPSRSRYASPTMSDGGFDRSISVDDLLPASVRQKRQVSLHALKARMDSYERRKPARMDSLPENGDADGGGRKEAAKVETTTPKIVSGLGHVRRQFGDEIVFCCPACEGDLITV